MTTVIAFVESLFSSGSIALFAAGVLLLETILLLGKFSMRTGRQLLVWNTFSGLSLISALYCALSGMDWKFTALFLSLALFAHLGDLRVRLAALKNCTHDQP